LWIAFAILLNPLAGRTIFPLGDPLYRPRRRPTPGNAGAKSHDVVH
jgi:hypothetical protein